MPTYNTAINPKEEGSTYAAELMYSRSATITKVIPRDAKDGVGGCTDLTTHTVWVPMGDTAKERTIRSHEAMHDTYTPVSATPKDLLDQGLEDARLHRHCSNAVHSAFQQNRTDEVITAVEELRAIASSTLPPSTVTSVVLLRCTAILKADTLATPHTELLSACLAKLGTDAERDFDKAIALLSDLGNWERARKVLRKYFVEGFGGGIGPRPPRPPRPPKAEPPPPPPPPEEEEGTGEEGGEGGTVSEGEGEEEGEEEGEGGTDSEEEGEGGTDTGRTGASGTPSTPTATPHGPFDSEDDSDTDSEDSEEEEEDSTPLAPPTPRPTPPPKPTKAEEEEYTADLTPDCDSKAYSELASAFPLKLYIRRLDMGTNRVKLSLGRRAPLPVISGRKILAGKLAGAMCNPSMRVFARSVAIGGTGTILIDASGSMAIPPNVLVEFLAKAPALTLAFYNAPSDSYGTHYGETTHGNIYIYAANGYRANVDTLDYSKIIDYGGGNMIDYQALAWLLKQPAPRYFVCDDGYTGPWAKACHRFARKLADRKDVVFVRGGLAQMGSILERLEKLGR